MKFEGRSQAQDSFVYMRPEPSRNFKPQPSQQNEAKDNRWGGAAAACFWSRDARALQDVQHNVQAGFLGRARGSGSRKPFSPKPLRWH